MSQSILPTKAYRIVLEREIERRTPENGLWHENWGDYNDPANRERVGRNILESMRVYEYPTRDPLTQVRNTIAVWLAPWLRT